MENVAKKMNLQFAHWMQDWPLEVGVASDIEKYIRHYETCRDDDEKFVLMEAIIQATEDQPNEIAFLKYWEQIRPMLIEDFSIHEYTVFYWLCTNSADETARWKISKKLRMFGN